MELLTLIEDANRQRSYLEILKADSTVDAESLAKCDYILTELTYSLDDLCNAWIPSEPAMLKTLLTRTVGNINAARDAVNKGISSVNPDKADHLLRLKLGLLAIDTLDLMLETLVLAMAAKQKTEIVN